MPEVKTKKGICEVHFYNRDDSKKRQVAWHSECKLWICKECDDTVLKATACVNKNIQLNHKKNKH